MMNNNIVYSFRLRLGTGHFLHGLMLLTLFLLGQSQQQQNQLVNNQQSDSNKIPPRRIQAFPNRDEVLKLLHEKGASIHSVSSSVSFTTSSSASSSSSLSSSSPPTISNIEDTNSTNNSGIDDNRVVGGTDADPTKYPFFTLIEIAKIFSDQTEAIDVCGGTLIASDIVLTAAHCFAEGEVTSITALINATSSETLTGFDYARDVTTHVTHPDFDAETFNYDVAILLLATPVTEVTPLLINSDSTIPEDGEDLELLGLGLLEENGSFPEFLQVVTLQSIPIATCQGNYAVYPDGAISVNETLQLCAAAPGKDACAADSGGPLIKTDGLSQLLVGTVSFGIGCALPEYPGVYARMSSLKSFIDEQVCALSNSPPDTCDTTSSPAAVPSTITPVSTTSAPTSTAPVSTTSAPTSTAPIVITPAPTTDAATVPPGTTFPFTIAPGTTFPATRSPTTVPIVGPTNTIPTTTSSPTPNQVPINTQIPVSCPPSQKQQPTHRKSNKAKMGMKKKNPKNDGKKGSSSSSSKNRGGKKKKNNMIPPKKNSWYDDDYFGAFGKGKGIIRMKSPKHV